jgi:phosphate transport system permease protein
MATNSPVRGRVKSVTANNTNLGDRLFAILTAITATVIVGIIVVFAVVLLVGSWNSVVRNGSGFLTGIDWPDNGFDNPQFGALNYIYGTLITSGFALLFGGLAGLGAAIFLSEYAPTWLRTPLSFLVELLAAVPSVVYGFWGVQFVSGFMGGPGGVEQSLHSVFGWLPLFGDKVATTRNTSLTVAFNGRDILVATLILSIMIIPTITSAFTLPIRQP